MKQFALSTFDNPYNPFEDFDLWNAFDIDHDYYSCSRLMRHAKLSDDMTIVEEEVEKERAIDEIIKYDLLNVYIKVSKDLEIPDDDVEI